MQIGKMSDVVISAIDTYQTKITNNVGWSIDFIVIGG